MKERKERKHCVSPTVLFLCTVFLVFVGVPPHWGLLWRTSVIKRKKNTTVSLPLRQPTIKRDCLRDDLGIF